MSFINNIRNTFENLFVPHDGLRDAAEEIIGGLDSDGNGRVTIAQLPGGSGIHALFAAADRDGNDNGEVSVKELRKALMQFDTDGNKAIEGLEALRLMHDMLTPPASAGPTQAGDGVGQIGQVGQGGTETNPAQAGTETVAQAATDTTPPPATQTEVEQLPEAPPLPAAA